MSNPFLWALESLKRRGKQNKCTWVVPLLTSQFFVVCGFPRVSNGLVWEVFGRLQCSILLYVSVLPQWNNLLPLCRCPVATSILYSFGSVIRSIRHSFLCHLQYITVLRSRLRFSKLYTPQSPIPNAHFRSFCSGLVSNPWHVASLSRVEEFVQRPIRSSKFASFTFHKLKFSTINKQQQRQGGRIRDAITDHRTAAIGKCIACRTF